MYAITTNELYHHGVMGQKWGQRQGPPYPLNASQHSARERKFGYKKSIGGGRNSDYYERNRQKANAPSTIANRKKSEKNSVLRKINSQGNSSSKNSTEKRKLTDEQKQMIKKVAIGTAIVAGAALTAYAAHKYITEVRPDVKAGNEAVKKLLETTGKDYEYFKPQEIAEVRQKAVLENMQKRAKETAARNAMASKQSAGRKAIIDGAKKATSSTPPSIPKTAPSVPKVEIPRVEVQRTEIPRVNINRTSINRTQLNRTSVEKDEAADLFKQLSENNAAFKSMANQTVKTANKASNVGEDLVADLLKKNSKKLGG